MFNGAKSFNQKLDSLELNPSVQLWYFLDSCGIDCKNYSKTLVGWANNPNSPINKDFYASGLKFSSVVYDARDILTTPSDEGGKGWTIYGDALSTDDCGLITSQEKATEQCTISINPNPAQEVLYKKCYSRY